MRLKFILVGFVLGLFVFPYVLNIEEGEAAGEVVADPSSCPASVSQAARIICLQNKVRQLTEQAKHSSNDLKETHADLQVCQVDLQTVEPEHEGECFEETHADDEHHASPVGVPGLGSLVRNEQPLTKIFANVQNIYYHTDQMKRSFLESKNMTQMLMHTLPALKANLEAIKACTTALKSNKGC